MSWVWDIKNRFSYVLSQSILFMPLKQWNDSNPLLHYPRKWENSNKPFRIWKEKSDTNFPGQNFNFSLAVVRWGDIKSDRQADGIHLERKKKIKPSFERVWSAKSSCFLRYLIWQQNFLRVTRVNTQTYIILRSELLTYFAIATR